MKVELIQIDDRLKGSLKNHNQLQERTGTESDKDQSRTRGPRKNLKAYTIFESFEGTVERLTQNGAIVRFDEGRASGFLPVNEIVKEGMPKSDEVLVSDVLQEDEQIEIRSVELDCEEPSAQGSGAVKGQKSGREVTEIDINDARCRGERDGTEGRD